MKIFVWGRVDHATENWHDEGGIVVFAASIDRARELISSRCPAECGALSDDPDLERDCIGGEERLFVMPDAGCC